MTIRRPARRSLIVIGPTPPPYHGVAVMTDHIVRAFSASGVLAAHLDTADRRPVDTIGRLDVENVRLALRHAFALGQLLRQHPGAAVYLPLSQGVWGFARDALLIAVARAFRRPVYGHLHGASFHHFCRECPALMRPVIRATLSALDEVWVLTPSLRGILSGLVTPERIRVLENVVDDSWPAGTRDVTETGAPLRIVFLANLLPEKGADDLLDALILVADQAHAWTVRLIGEVTPPVRDRIEGRLRCLAAMGVDVQTTGVLVGAEKDRELSEADVFAYPTRDDGQPLVVLEAMAAALPIVATREGGIPETIPDGTHSLLVATGDTRALAAALVRLSEDPALRARLGNAARRRYEERYTPARLQADLAVFRP